MEAQSLVDSGADENVISSYVLGAHAKDLITEEKFYLEGPMVGLTRQ